MESERRLGRWSTTSQSTPSLYRGPTNGQGASVWDAKVHDWVVHQVGRAIVLTVALDQISTGTGSQEAPDLHSVNVLDVTTREWLVDLLEHDGVIVGVEFSPNGIHIAVTTSEFLVAEMATSSLSSTIRCLTGLQSLPLSGLLMVSSSLYQRVVKSSFSIYISTGANP